MLWASLHSLGMLELKNPIIISFSGFGDTEATCLSESTAAAAFPGALRSGSGSV